MAVTDLQHEIGFVLRLNQWPEESWQHRQLSELIAELETALAARLAEPIVHRSLHQRNQDMVQGEQRCS